MRRVLRCSGQMWRWRTALTIILMLVAVNVVCAAPTVSFTTPAETSYVSLDSKIQVAFSEPVDANLVDARHVTLSKKLKVVAIAAGPSHALAVRNDGTVASWRYSMGFTDARDNIPAGLTGVTAVAAGDYHSLALKSDGTVVAWGKNANGQCNVPANLSGVVAIAAGTDFSVALKNDGTLVSWGRGPVLPGVSGIKAISAYSSFVLALKNDGSVIGWGFDGYRPGAIPALSGVAGISQGFWHGLAVKCDGTVTGWGDNSYGERIAPAGLTDVKAVAAGFYFSLALKGDGTVVAWGKDGSNMALSVVPSDLKNVVAIAAGEKYAIALKNDGTVVGWGGVASSFLPPVSPLIPDEPSEVTAVAQGGSFGVVLRRDGTVAVWGNTSAGQGNIPAGLSGVKAIAAGFYHALALKGDGSLVGWGWNPYGQATVPAQLIGVPVKAVAAGEFHSVALKNDGTVVAWGKNDYQQCNVPSGLSGVVAIAAGRYFSAALKNDGSVVVWGSASNGLLPVPQKALANVKAIAAGYYHMLALKTDGTVVGWGQNTFGQAADQTAGTFVDIAATENNSAALRSDGTVYTWGSEASSSTFMPAGLNGVRKLSGNAGNIAALKSNNTVVSWGAGNNGQSEVTHPYRNANIYESLVTGEVNYDAATRTATLTPSSPLEAAGYLAEATFIANPVGEMLAAPALLSFSTVGYQAPELLKLAGSPFCPGSATYKITGTVAGNAGGTISCDSTVSSGASAKCTTTNGSGYQLTALTDNGSSVLTQVSSNVYTILNVQADHAVVATFTDSADPVITAPSDKYFEATGVTTLITAAMIGTATASDNSGNFSVTSDFTEGDYRVGSFRVIWTAIDPAGHSATATQTVTVGDKTAPALIVPNNMVVEGTSSKGALVNFTVTATDAVDPAPVVTCSPVSGAVFPIGDTVVTCTAKDSSNNVAAPQSFTVKVQDTTAPVLSLPDNMVVEATSSKGALVPFAVSAADAVDPAPVVTCSPVSGSLFSLGDTVVTCTAKDSSNNVTAPKSFTVKVQDTTAPVLSLPNDMVVEATSSKGALVPFTVSAADAVDPAPVVTCSPVSGSLFSITDTVVTCTAKDSSNNTAAPKTFSVKVQDTTPPVLSVPENMVVEATSHAGAQVEFTVSATDAVDPSPTFTCSHASGSIFALGETIVSCSGKDSSNNPTGTKSFTITVQDTTAPQIAPPKNVAIEATGPLTHVTESMLGKPVATDAVGDISITSNLKEADYPLTQFLVTWFAQDSAHNTGSSTPQTVSVVDTTAPVLSVPSDMVVEATSPQGAAVPFTVAATDAVDPSPAITCTQAPGAVFPISETVVTCSAKDSSSNATGSKSFSVKVQDTTAPVLSVPDNIVVEATSPAGAQVNFTVSATDAVDPSPAITCSQASGSVFTLGETIVSCSAKDSSNNATGTKSFSIKVQDTTAPQITAPKNVEIEATGAFTRVTKSMLGVPTATDAVGDIAISNDLKEGDYALTQIPVIWYAQDSAHNVGTSTPQIVSVVDTTAPVLTVPATIVREATSRAGAQVEFSVTAVDLVDPNPVLSCTYQSGSTFKVGDTIVTCTATDAKNNSVTHSFTVTVEDTTDPIIAVPADKVVEATGVSTRIDDIGEATATDIFAVTIGNDAPADKLYGIGTRTITWTATDENKRSASGKQQITVQDTTAPVVTAPANSFIEATGPVTHVTAEMIGKATATDAVGVASITSNFLETDYALGTIRVTWQAKDAAGNVGTALQTQLITVRDTTAPVLTVPKDINVIVNTPLSDPAVQGFLHGATATDTVSLPVTITSTTPDLATVGAKVVTFTATDAAGNAVSGTATIHVVYGCGDTYVNNEAANYLTPVNLLKPFKLGSTVSVKLHLCDANGVDVTSASAQIFVQLFNNNEPVGDPIEPTSTSGADTENFFRVVGNMYMYNLNTKSLNMGSYQLQAVLDDGTTRTIPLALKQ